MKKLYHYSDLHGKKPIIPAIFDGNADDLFIFTGDIAPTFVESMKPCVRYNGQITPSSWNSYWNFRDIDPRMEAELQGNWIESVFKPHLVENKISPEQVIFLAGNHEFVNPEKHFKYAASQTPKTLEIGGVKFGLCPGSGLFTGEWSDEISNEDFGKRLYKLDADIEVLLTHQPPYGILDKTYSHERVGSQALSDAIFGKNSADIVHFYALRLSLFGHIHDNAGKESLNIGDRKIDFYNACGKIPHVVEFKK